VAYASCELQTIIPLKIIKGSCVEQAITLSGILTHFSEIDLKRVKVGLFGNICSLNKILLEGDRVEIYRALICDPKQARRNRVK
jgi:putative ubiquitin-RnfH superfamily antitoxin RatB of RatAB toxin-antitoxin module